MTTRFSSLPILQYCGGSAALNVAAGRAAAMGTAFHALCSGDPSAPDLFALLSEDEQGEVSTWHRPATITIGQVTLDYNEGAKEVSCGLSASGRFVPKGDPSAIVEGTADVFWFVSGVLYLGDIKRSKRTASHDSLQLRGYALALADKYDAAAFRCGIWGATEGEWSWGPEIRLDSDEAARSWDRVRLAATRDRRELSTGSHCSDCYSRTRCPAYLVDPRADFAASPLLSEPLDQASALELLSLADRLEETAKLAKERAKAFAAHENGIRSGDKVWAATIVDGRPSFDSKAFEKAHPDLAKEYTRRGKPYERFSWTKVKA